MRKLVTIRIDPQVWQTAREFGLNISRTCENCLKQEIQRLQTPDPKTDCTVSLVPGAGFEPATSGRVYGSDPNLLSRL